MKTPANNTNTSTIEHTGTITVAELSVPSVDQINRNEQYQQMSCVLGVSITLDVCYTQL